MVPIYVNLIKSNPNQEEIIKINNMIIERWSSSALIYIKDKAWKIVEQANKMPGFKDVMLLGVCTDKKARMIYATEAQKNAIIQFLIKSSDTGKIKMLEHPILFK